MRLDIHVNFNLEKYMEYLWFAIGGFIAYTMFSKFSGKKESHAQVTPLNIPSATIVREKETDIDFDTPNEWFSYCKMSFSLESWLAETVAGKDDMWFRDIYEIRRTAPMVWEWRHVDCADESAGSENKTMRGSEYIIKEKAYRALLEIDGIREKLKESNPDFLGMTTFKHEDDRFIYKQLANADLIELFTEILEKSRIAIKTWEEIPHSRMVKLEAFYLANT